MATSSTTLRLVHPVDIAREPRASESRVRRLFRRRARRRSAVVSNWREDATFRGMTRMGA
jgi:hypothetical protein